MAEIKEVAPDIPIILMTAYSTVQKAVEAMRQGAFTYVNKPFEADEMVLNVRTALETTRLRREVHALRRMHADEGIGAIVAESEAMRAITASWLSRPANWGAWTSWSTAHRCPAAPLERSAPSTRLTKTNYWATLT